MAREYEMPRWITAPEGADNVWDLLVRPREKSRLEIELSGGMDTPVLTVNGDALRFPVLLKPGHRLMCRGQRHWAIFDARRASHRRRPDRRTAHSEARIEPHFIRLRHARPRASQARQSERTMKLTRAELWLACVFPVGPMDHRNGRVPAFPRGSRRSWSPDELSPQ